MWLELEDQDDDLITDPKTMPAQTKCSVSGEKQHLCAYKGIHFDLAPEVHGYAREITSQIDRSDVHSNLCVLKSACLRNFMRFKSFKEKLVTETIQYNLKNSMIPTLKETVLSHLKEPYWIKDNLLTNVLSSSSVFKNYNEACRSVQDWTLALDYGPFR